MLGRLIRDTGRDGVGLMDLLISQMRRRFLALDSSAVSDAMDGLMLDAPRVLKGLVPRMTGAKLVGPVFTVTYESHVSETGRFANAGTYIDDVPEGQVVLVDSQGRGDCTNWGDLLTRLALRKGLAGTVVHGAVRDIADIRSLGYPLYSTAVNAVSGKNRTRMVATGRAVEIDGTVIAPGDWLFGDDNALMRLPADQLTEILTRAEQVSLTEDRIAQAIEAGTALKEARRRYGYDIPWVVKNDHAV
jgi:regulator of RNase E activity RraA